MSEWPTLVRTAVAPAASIVSGTMSEVMRLCSTTISPVSPAARTRVISRRATIAATADGVTASPVLVDDEAAVGIAVEGESEVGAVLDDGLLQVDEVRRLERVRLVVRKGAVELEVHRNDLDRQRGQPGGGAEHGGNGESAHAVAGIDDDAQRADAGEVDELAQLRRVVGQHVQLAVRAGGLDRRYRR